MVVLEISVVYVWHSGILTRINGTDYVLGINYDGANRTEVDVCIPNL